MNELRSIGIFIDGGYFAKINELLHDNLSLNIRIKDFLEYIRREVARRNGSSLANCFVTESHYFRGRYRVNEANEKHLLYSERKFEDALIENDIIFHYKHLREVYADQQHKVIEKGIDVWFALQAYELSLYREFDYVVLITGDADHEMLIKKLKAIKRHVVLVTWEIEGGASSARLLREETCTHIEISKALEQDKDLLMQLCKTV